MTGIALANDCDIFLSYSREDGAKIELLVEALSNAGLRVFWDREILPGETWESYIGVQLDRARVVIVAWSEHAINSRFVKAEATRALRREVLVPISLTKVEPPFGFDHIHAHNLDNWIAQGGGQLPERLTVSLSRRIPGMSSAATPVAVKSETVLEATRAPAHSPTPSEPHQEFIHSNSEATIKKGSKKAKTSAFLGIVMLGVTICSAILAYAFVAKHYELSSTKLELEQVAKELLKTTTELSAKTEELNSSKGRITQLETATRQAQDKERATLKQAEEKLAAEREMAADAALNKELIRNLGAFTVRVIAPDKTGWRTEVRIDGLTPTDWSRISQITLQNEGKIIPGNGGSFDWITIGCSDFAVVATLRSGKVVTNDQTDWCNRWRTAFIERKP